mgnify:CR=1 FL=1
MTRKIAYIDCFSGAAGDMLLAACVHAGCSLSKIKEGLESIAEIRGQWDIQEKKVTKGEVATQRVWRQD